MIFIKKRLKPICAASPMLLGSVPNDDGNFFLTETERKEIIAKDKSLLKLIRPFLGAYEYIHNIRRYCFWLDGVSPDKYAHSKEVHERIKNHGFPVKE
ncbi:MAG: hypothetical protein LBC46_00315 [Treponema sp.]|jgi:hypothetical protein|nr:hypothetical protein [Treponema sp.]